MGRLSEWMGVLVFLSCCFVFHEVNFHGVRLLVAGAGRWGGLFSWDTGTDKLHGHSGANWHPRFALLSSAPLLSAAAAAAFVGLLL